jgi:hypothetical protein
MAGGAMLHHRQWQCQGELARLLEKSLLHEAGGTPNMVHQPQGRSLLWRKVGQFPQKEPHLGARSRHQARVRLGQSLALGGRHKEDGRTVVLRRHVLPGHWYFPLHVCGDVNDRKRNRQMVEHGGERAKVFAQAQRRCGVSHEIESCDAAHRRSVGLNLIPIKNWNF